MEAKEPIELSSIPELKDGLEEDHSEADEKPSSSNDAESECETCRKAALTNKASNLSRSFSYSNNTETANTTTDTNSI